MRRGHNVRAKLRKAVLPLIERIEARVLMTTVYGITDIGNLGGGNTAVAAINDSGKIVGGSDVKSGVQHPFVYANGKMTDLGVPAGFTSASAVAINKKGDILILASNPDLTDPNYGDLSSVFLDVGGVFKNIGLLPTFNTVTYVAFNNSDTIVGACAGEPTPGDIIFGQFIYTGGKLSALNTPAQPFAINDSGFIVGNGFTDSNGVITPLGDLGGSHSSAEAVNASGESTGYVPDGFGDGLAIYTPAGALTDVPIPGQSSAFERFAFGESINDAGVVVGSVDGFAASPNATHALIEQGGLVQDLNALIDPASGITLMDAPSINNNGVIVATTSNGHSVILTPETKTLASISGTVFNDANGDGVQQGAEAGLAGQTVYLDTNSNGVLDIGEPTALTDSAGHYSFDDLWGGTYTVGSVPQNNAWKQTAPSGNGEHAVTLKLGQSSTGQNFAEQQVVAYTLTDLSSFASGAIYGYDAANAINGSGQIAGSISTATASGQATVTTNGITKILTKTSGNATGINDSGQVVGYFTVGAGAHQTTDAFVYYNGKFTNLGTLKGDISSTATAINNNGEIVGTSTSPVPPSDPNNPFDFETATTRGFIDINGKLTAVNPTSGMNLFMNAVNNKGVFVGEENTPGYKGPDFDVPFISVNGKVVDISSLEGSLNAINNLGQAVGTGDDQYSGGTFSGAFLYYGKKVTPLAGLQSANGINDAGTIIGTVSTDGLYGDGAVYVGGKAIDLNNVTPTNGLVINGANAINAANWIAAEAIDSNNNEHAVLLKPVLATVSGNVFWDKSSSGVYKAGDPELSGRQVYVDVGYKGHYVAGDPVAYTDANGNYTLTNVPTGGCVVRATPQGGWYQTVPSANAGIWVSAGAGSNITIKSFGEATPANLTLSGEVFNDLNDSAGKNPKDPGIGKVTVYIDANNDGKLDNGEQSTVTAGDGSYSFNKLLPGTYVVRAVTPSGFKQSTPLKGGANNITLSVGRSVNNAYFGETAIK